jgi:hypothetical protein
MVSYSLGGISPGLPRTIDGVAPTRRSSPSAAHVVFRPHPRLHERRVIAISPMAVRSSLEQDHHAGSACDRCTRSTHVWRRGARARRSLLDRCSRRRGGAVLAGADQSLKYSGCQSRGSDALSHRTPVRTDLVERRNRVRPTPRVFIVSGGRRIARAARQATTSALRSMSA